MQHTWMKAQMRQNDTELEDFERESLRAICKDLPTLPRASGFSLPLAQKPRRLRCILKPPDEDQVCPITMDKISEFTKEYPYDYADPNHEDYSVLRLPCKHEFAALPLIYYWAFGDTVKCPMCRAGPDDATLADELPECIETHFQYRDLWLDTADNRLREHKLHFNVEGLYTPGKYVRATYAERDGNVVLTAKGPEVEAFLRKNRVIRLHMAIEFCYFKEFWSTPWFRARDKAYTGDGFTYTVTQRSCITLTVPQNAFWLAWFVQGRVLTTKEDPCYLPYLLECNRLAAAAHAAPPPED
jgi:hypothetical protein